MKNPPKTFTSNHAVLHLYLCIKFPHNYLKTMLSFPPLSRSTETITTTCRSIRSNITERAARRQPSATEREKERERWLQCPGRDNEGALHLLASACTTPALIYNLACACRLHAFNFFARVHACITRRHCRFLIPSRFLFSRGRLALALGHITVFCNF